MKVQATVVQPCGEMEKFSTARHSLGLYRCVSVTGRYAVPPRADVKGLKNGLCRAIAQVILEQPSMRIGIIDEDKQTPCFVHIPRIDLSDQVQWFGPSRPDTVDAALGTSFLSARHIE